MKFPVSRRHLRRRLSGVAAVAALALALTACSGSVTLSPSAAPAAAGTPSATGACVVDPAAVIAAPAAASGAVPQAVADALQAKVAEAMGQIAATGAVVSVQSPEGTWTQAFGVADPATNAPMTTDLYQRVGSITKTFTGTVILQLVQEGKLSLDDPIERYVPGMPNGSTVTIRTLIDMTSGLASYTLDDNWQQTFFTDPHRVWMPDELVNVARGLTPLFTPGSQYNYSNTNTVLLGKVIEAVTGTSVEEQYQQRIIGPLGLSHTSFPGLSADFPSPHAQGFTLQSPTATPQAPTNATDWNPSWGWTAGEMISSVTDLATYGRALVTGQGLLDPAMQTERLDSFPADRGTYSYGYALGCVDGWVGHTGELPGYNSAIYFQTDSNTMVAIIANSETLSGDCTVSPVQADNTTGIPCNAPTGRLLSAVGDALGHPFVAPDQK